MTIMKHGKEPESTVVTATIPSTVEASVATSTAASSWRTEHGLTDQHISNGRLFNPDIAPRTGKGNWGTGSLFNWWMSAWHSLGGYAMAVGFMALGLNGWQALLGMAIGMIAMWGASNLMGVAGQRVGVPFPVLARMSFGVNGANIPAFLRAIVAVCWYGIQTFLASQAVLILALKIFPGLEPLNNTMFLGLSQLGWMCLLLLWAAQLFVLHRGMETVRRLSDFAGPTIWIAMIALALWTLSRADWKLDWNYTMSDQVLTGGAAVVGVLSVASLVLAYMAGPMLNFADFTRMSSSESSVRRGNALGLLLNGIAFALISVIIGIASAEVYGAAVTDPILLLGDLDSITLLLVATLAVSVAQVGVNIICNFVSASFDFAHLAPKAITFKIGGVITAVLAIVVMPWHMYSSPIIINYFLGGVGALVGPLFGILIADFYLVKKSKFIVKDLYTSAPQGAYHYSGGFNVPYIAAFLLCGIVTLIVALVPAFSALASFSWPIGVTLGFLSVLAIKALSSKKEIVEAI
ncbi:MAG: NCS1 family nucleobase:cation symporter-1 [Corynebacterium flavescens]|uniref:NCS1 family nucleobase:cation symporter-1 n=1 Tax=Corynebacterium flavescens TaxID=28028 RepID=UPI003F8F5996